MNACVTKDVLCDGEVDCEGGEDEKGCIERMTEVTTEVVKGIATEANTKVTTGVMTGASADVLNTIISEWIFFMED